MFEFRLIGLPNRWQRPGYYQLLRSKTYTEQDILPRNLFYPADMQNEVQDGLFMSNVLHIKISILGYKYIVFFVFFYLYYCSENQQSITFLSLKMYFYNTIALGGAYCNRSLIFLYSQPQISFFETLVGSVQGAFCQEVFRKGRVLHHFPRPETRISVFHLQDLRATFVGHKKSIWVSCWNVSHFCQFNSCQFLILRITFSHQSYQSYQSANINS